uniref:ditrans,polycis-polyprenyl diphosphate synthase [(2E,6E)-farnesyldiphosphate specific] n=1 Tax=Cacopsylla melanoneura TaxID=428564 RepID=A0A8D8YMF2_9HEMI
MFLHKYFYKFLYLVACVYYFLSTNLWLSLMHILNPFKLNKNLHNEIVNNKSTLFLTLINNWKKPNHLVLIIGEDVILYNDITQIILWCMIAGISFVSIYDYKNRLSHVNLMSAIKSNQMFEEISALMKLQLGFSFDTVVSKNGKLHNSVVLDSGKMNRKTELTGINKYYAGDVDRILTIIEDGKTKNIATNRTNGKHLSNGINGSGTFDINHSKLNGHCHGNGIDPGHKEFDERLLDMMKSSNGKSSKTELNILSRKQCETDLMNSIIEISETTADISTALLEEKLYDKCPLPDPEVGIVLGNKLSSYGLLPWNIRLTEFFKFDNYRDISVNKFNSILMKYSKCEQRLGK